MTDNRCEIRFAGFGGQGVVTAAAMFGSAASKAGWNTSGSTVYGSQARGGATYADVVLSKGEIDFPHLEQADYFVALSQEAYDTYIGSVLEGGTVLFDSFHVKPREAQGIRQAPVPATRLSVDSLGSPQAANMIMLAALAALSGVVTQEDLARTVEAEGSARFVETNLKALSMGFGLFMGERP